jgi:phosphoserine phosphatase
MVPLAVDLDGTLIRTDVFRDALVRFCTTRPWNAALVAIWLMRGRPYVKGRLARRYPLDASVLPYDERLLAWLRDERANGRRIVLATAADRADADAVAAHLGLFDAVIASDGRQNFKSARKAQALAAMFPDGFVYAGNESADLKVWAAAKAAVIVNAAPALEQDARARFMVERVFPRVAEAQS